MLITSEYRPITVLPCIMGEKSISFLSPTKKTKIKGKWAKVIKKVLKYCNGNFTISEIAKATDSEEDLIIEVISQLVSCEAVLDSREQYKHFHKISSFPTVFTSDRTQKEISAHFNEVWEEFGDEVKPYESSSELQKVMELRYSCRSYQDRLLSHEQLINLCANSYRRMRSGHFNLPSAGGLYPLSLNLILDKDINSTVRAGYYSYDPTMLELVRDESRPLDIEQLKYCLNMEDFFGAHVLIVISADIDRQAYKYANRAYRFSLIEAGHLAQNLTLSAIEMGLGTCELGGFLDSPLKAELALPENIDPLLVMTVGYEDTAIREVPNYAKFIEQNVGINFPAESVKCWTSGDGFYVATAEFNNRGTIDISGATARTGIMACYKAVIEAYERWETFNGDHELIDNSCGVSAHFDLESAQKSALSELIERDAIMRCWEFGVVPSKLTPIGSHTKKRQDYWAEQDRTLSILSMHSRYAPVILVTITGNEYPYFVCGAASSVEGGSDPKATLEYLEDKALLEAESALVCYLDSPEEGEPPCERDVCTPDDHGRLYRMNKDMIEEARWIMNGEYVSQYPTWDKSYEEIKKLSKVEFTTLGQFHNGLQVVRAESPNLLKMTFGNPGHGLSPHFFA